MGLADIVESVGNAFDDAIHAAAAIGQTVVDQGVIDEVKRSLQDAASEFDSGSFRSAAIAVSRFGASPEGSELGGHHSRAHDVIQETLKGIVDDLVAFNDNVQKAADFVIDADEKSGSDLKAKMKVVQGFEGVADHSMGDAANDAGRNHHHYHNHLHPTGGK